MKFGGFLGLLLVSSHADSTILAGNHAERRLGIFVAIHDSWKLRLDPTRAVGLHLAAERGTVASVWQRRNG
jgi:hypothetical protein